MQNLHPPCFVTLSILVGFLEMRKVHPWHVTICITKAAQHYGYLNYCFFLQCFSCCNPSRASLIHIYFFSLFWLFCPFFNQNNVYLNHMSHSNESNITENIFLQNTIFWVIKWSSLMRTGLFLLLKLYLRNEIKMKKQNLYINPTNLLVRDTVTIGIVIAGISLAIPVSVLLARVGDVDAIILKSFFKQSKFNRTKMHKPKW